MAEQVLQCERHGAGTRLTCAECGTPICPRCMVRTDVGLRCERCAAPVPVQPAARSRPRLALPIAAAVAGLAVLVAAVAVALLGDRGTREAAQPAVGEWTRGPALQLVRGSTSAVPLGDGRVAVLGGGLGSVPLAATELFDARTGRWSPSAELAQARRGHRAAVLDDGRVLAAGGIAGGQLLNSAELYDPSDSSWRPAGEMTLPRLGHTMTVLRDGTVLVTGGTGEAGAASQGSQSIRPVADAEVFDPTTGSWTRVGRMLVARFEHTATLLPDGRVLLAGGLGPEDDVVAPVASAELYDPATRTFSRTGAMAAARTDHAAAALGDGRVLVVGGDAGSSAVGTAEIYDPSRGSWSQAVPLLQARRGHSATVLGDGTVLVAGGEFFTQGTRTSLAAAERYDPTQDAWVNAGEMSCARSEHGAALLSDGRVLVAAGDAVFPGQPPIAQSCVDLYAPEDAGGA